MASVLDALAPGEHTSVIVTLRDNIDLAQIAPNSSHSRQQQRAALIDRLQRQAGVSQKGILTQIESWQRSGEVERVVPLWISNAISISASAEVIRTLLAHPDVLEISPELVAHAPAAPDTVEYSTTNLDRIGVEKVWQQGFFGQGIVVASLDTGVDYTHPDLQTRWRGGSNSWYDPFGEHPEAPFASSSHGTWTMGVMVGGDSTGTPIGIAPQAEWISAKIFDDSGIATETAIHLSYQWLLDPDGDPQTDDAPDVVNNSWGFDLTGCITSLERDLQVLRAAGILPIFSAGNSGPNTNTSVSPANNPEAFAVGAINNDDLIHASSSRGPSACNPEAVYPVLVAPGENILTTGLQSTYASPSGTSLSAPHVTGSLALLLSAAPDLTIQEQEELLIAAAEDLGPGGPDSDYGYGLLNVWAAYEQLDIAQVPAVEQLLFLPLLIGR